MNAHVSRENCIQLSQQFRSQKSRLIVCSIIQRQTQRTSNGARLIDAGVGIWAGSNWKRDGLRRWIRAEQLAFLTNEPIREIERIG